MGDVGAQGSIVRGRPAIAIGRLLDARTLAIGASVPALALGGVAVAAAPVTACLAAVVAGGLALAWYRPAWALAGAVLLFGFEGSVKLLLGLEPTPVPIENRALGAGALDLVLFASFAGLLAADRLRTPRALWSRAGRAGRVLMTLMGAWLALSILQIPQSGDLRQGLAGFRLFHAYTLVAVAAAIAFAARGAALRGARALLAIGLVVSLYGAVRVVIGPAFEESVFAVVRGSNATYGPNLRAVGSFSSAVGMESFLTPLCAFGLVVGYLEPRLRRFAWPMAALAIVAIGGAYGRAPLMATAVGLALTLGVVLAAADMRGRRKLVAVALCAAVLTAMYGGLEVAGTASRELDTRAAGILNPLADDSVKGRLVMWGDTIRDLPSHPLGHGVGTVGAASERKAGTHETTDNSVLKVAVDQGVPVTLLLVAVLLGAVALLTARLRRLTAERHAIGVAAVAGFVAYLVLSTTGEYVEQPGKVVAWGLLGVAAAQAFGPAGGGADCRRRRVPARRGGPPRAVWVAAIATMVLVPAGLTLGRDRTQTASMQIFPRPAGPLPAVHDPAHYRVLHRAAMLWLAREERVGPWYYRDAEFRAGPHGSVVMSLEAANAARAERSLNALSRQIVRASRRDATETATALAYADARRLAGGGLSPGQRLRLNRRARGLRQLAAAPPPGVALGAPAATPRPPRWADRVADAVPGELPGRPSPVWAGVAGGLVTAALLGIVALALPRGRARST